MIIFGANVLLHPNGINHVKQVTREPLWWVYWVIFAVYLFSLLHSSNLKNGWFAVQMKLPFLILPIAFCATPGLRKRDLQIVLYLFVVFTAIVSVDVLITYLKNYQVLTEGFKAGGSLLLPVRHPRFSLLVAIAIFTAIYLFQQKVFVQFKWERVLLAFLALLLFLTLHVLAVRSGLFAFYISLFIFILVQIVRNKKNRIQMAVVLFGMICLPVLAYFIVPSLQNKIRYMKYDIEMLLKGENKEMPLSDSDRVYSYFAGWKIVKDNPLIGVGIGDLQDAVSATYRERYSNMTHRLLLPHNQFLYIASFAGIIGLLLFSWAVLYPFFQQFTYNNWFYFMVILLLLLSFLVEYTLETQLGTTIYVFFTMIALKLSYLSHDSFS